MKLSDYVMKRNGVPLGAAGSLRNMLTRSLGAGQFSTFWKYWNPIWGYYLGKYVFKPLKAILPASISLVLTFAVSGFVHDLAISLVAWKIYLLFTPWFVIMALWIVISEWIGIDYSGYYWPGRALVNLVIIGVSLLLTRGLIS